MSDHNDQHEQGDKREQRDEEATAELQNTAEHWRQGHAGDEVEESASEVARGAERGSQQPEYGREGS